MILGKSFKPRFFSCDPCKYLDLIKSKSGLALRLTEIHEIFFKAPFWLPEDFTDKTANSEPDIKSWLTH